MSDVYQSSNAAANLTKIFEAAAEAKKSQVDLQKEVMLHQLQQKMDLEKHATELQQGVESNINQKNANINWVNSMGDNSTPSASTGNGIGDSGIATSGTPNAVAGGPMASVVNPAQAQQPLPQTPPMSMADPSQQPANDAASQLTMPSVSHPPVQAQSQPPSSQYTNLGYKPKEAQQLLQERQQNGQSPNVADATYVQALNKVKQGTASDGELSMVHQMNGKDANGHVYPEAAKAITENMSPFQKGILSVKAKMGPQFTLDGNGDVVQDPQWKALMDAKAQHEAGEPDRQQARQDRLYNQAVNEIATKQVSYRSGSIGLQDQKVSQAIHARQLINQAYDPKTGQYDVTQVPYGELSESLGSLLAGGTGSSEGRINALKQRTAAGDLNGIATYLSGKPTNAAPQDVLKQLVSMIDRQGTTAEDIRDGDVKRLKHAVLDGSGLDDERKQAMINSPSIGASYRDILKQSPDHQQPKLYGGMTISDAKAQGYTGFDTEKNQWVK